VERDGGVTVVNMGAVVGDLLKDRITFDDVQPNAVSGRKNAENHVMCMDDGFQRQDFDAGRINEIAGLGRELMQFFELGHCLLQRN
jgi:hypothetical protein